MDPNNFTVMDFGGLFLTSPICHINTATAPGVVGAATYAAAALTPAHVAATAAAVTTNAANQALIAQQAAAQAALATTLTTKFNSNHLPPKAKAQYENHLNPSYLMTKTDIVVFYNP